MKCTEISSRLVDFLYEELPAAERAEFDTHLASCPTCAAEVKASSRALQRTRTALRGPLNEEPPARVHANILAAARAAAQPARKPRVEEKEGFFARLWKAPWLIPAMGAAGVATAVFLIKVIKNPEVLPVREPASPAAAVSKPRPTEEKAPRPVLAPAEPQAEAAPVDVSKGDERKARAVKRERAGAAPARSSPASLQGAVPRRMRISDDPLDGIGVGSHIAAPSPAPRPEAQAARATPSPKPAAAARPLNAPGGWAEPPPPRSLAGKGRASGDMDMLSKEGASGAGASQPRGEAFQAQPQPAAEAPRPARTPPAASAFALPPAPSAAPAKAAPAPVESRAKAKKSAEAEKYTADEESVRDDMAESAPLRSPPAAKDAERADKKGSASKDSFEERVRKADKLYSEKKWYEAATAYRALLDEAPKHPSAPTWRQRFLLAEKAHKEGPLIRAKSKLSADPLDGI